MPLLANALISCLSCVCVLSNVDINAEIRNMARDGHPPMKSGDYIGRVSFTSKTEQAYVLINMKCLQDPGKIN